MGILERKSTMAPNADLFPAARRDAMAAASREFHQIMRFDASGGVTVDAVQVQNYLTPGARKIYAALASRHDAAETAWVARQLEYMRPGLLEVQYPKLKGRVVVPIDNEVPNGAAEVTQRSMDYVGKAAISSGHSNQAPRVDVKVSEANQKIRSITDSYGYSIQDMRYAMMAGVPLDAWKAKAARAVIERTLDDILFLGDPATGLKGFLTLLNTNSYTIPNGAAGSPLWSRKTALEVLADLTSLVAKVVTDSKEVESPTTLLIALTAYNEINTRPIGLDANKTILEFFLKSNPYVGEVIPSHKLEASSDATVAPWGNYRLMIAYDKNPEKVLGVHPQEFEQFAPQWEGMDIVTICHARSGGVVSNFLKSIITATGF
jgi:hypothetical protein